MTAEQRVGLEEKSIFWKIWLKAESFIAGERITAVKENLWGTDGKDPDGKTKFKVIGSKVVFLPKWQGGVGD